MTPTPPAKFADARPRVRAGLLLTLATILLVGLFTRPALAETAAATAEPALSDEARASQRYREAREADDAGDLERAEPLYREAIALDPSARWASRTIARLRAIERLTADPAIEALADIKRTYQREDAARAVADAAALLDIATTDLGRADVHLWLGLQHARVLGDPERANAHFVAVEALPGSSPAQLEAAMLLGVREAQTWGQLLTLRRSVIHARATRTDLARSGLDTPRDEVDDALFRRVAYPAAWASLAGLLALFIVRRGAAKLRTLRPAAIGLIVYAFGFGAFLAERWEHGYAAAFVCTIGAAIAVHGLSVGVRPPADASKRNRWGTAALVALASVGAVYLVFDVFNHQAVFGL